MNRLLPTTTRAILTTALAAVLPLFVPHAKAQTYTYSGTTSNTANTADLFSTSPNWSPTPQSSATTILNFSATLPGATAAATIFTDNDIANPFLLNALNFSYGSLNAFGGNVTIEDTGTNGTGQNDALEFISNGATTPTLTLNATSSVGGAVPTLTIAEPVQFANTLTVTGASNATISGAVSGAGGLTVGTAGGSGTSAFSGVLTLSGANAYTGATAINSGIVNDQNASGLGGTTTGVTVASGATLELSGAGITTNAKALTITGTGATGTTGALDSVSGANTYAGAITLNGNATVSSDTSAVALTLSGAISGSGTGNVLTLTGAGNGVITGLVGATVGGVTKNGGGTWYLESHPETYTGSTVVNAGTLYVAQSGSINTTGSLTVGSATTGPATFGTSNPGAQAGTVTLGSTTIGGINSVIILGGSNANNINLGPITINSGASVDFNVGGTGVITGSTTITPTNGITGGFATYGSGTTWAVVPNSNGTITGLATGAYTTASNGSTYGSTLNVDEGAASTTAGANASFNSIRFSSNASNYTLTLSGYNVITTGGILFSTTLGGGTAEYSGLSGGTITSATGTLYIQSFAGGNTLGANFVNSVLADYVNGGTTTPVSLQTGRSILTITGLNTYTGATTIGANVLTFTSLSNISGGANLAAPNSLGLPTAANATIALINGTKFQDAAAGSVSMSSDRPLSLIGPGYGSASVIQNGSSSSALAFSGGITSTNQGISLAANNGAIVETGNISLGSGALSTSGGNGIILTGTNMYTGATSIGNVTQIGNNGTTGTLPVGSVITANSTLVFNRSNAVTQGTDFSSSSIGGTGGITQAGGGTLTLNAAETYTGATTVNNGTLQLGNGTSGSISGATASALTFSGSGTFNDVGVTTGSAQTMGALTFSAGQGTVQSTYGGTSGNTLLTFASLAARAAGATGNFVTSGGTNGTSNKITFTTAPTAGALIDRGEFFNGTSYAAYDSTGFVRAYGTGDTGYTTAAGGTSTIATGTATNVALTGSETAQATASINTLNLGANSVALTTTGVFQTNGILESGGGSTITNGTSLSTTTASTDLVIRVNGTNDTLGISTPIINNGTTALTVSGAGVLTLSGANKYTGTTTVDSGTLRAGVATVGTTSGAFGVGSAVVMGTGAGATLDLNNFNETLGSLAGGSATGGNVTLGSGTLTLNNPGTTYAGAISGTGGVTKNGGNTFILTGADTYTGTTTIGAGTLQLGSAAVTSSVSSASLTGSLSPSSAIVDNGILAINRANTVTQGTDFSTAAISGTGGLTQMGGGATILTAANTFNGATTVAAGILDLDNALALQNSTVTVNTATVATVVSTVTVFSATNNTGTLMFDQGVGGNAFTIGGLSGAGNITLANNNVTAPAAIALTVGNNNAATTYSGILSGAGSLTKAGSGALTLSGANTYTGTTAVNAGTLLVNGSTGTGAVNVNGTGTTTTTQAFLGGTGTIGGAVTLGSGTTFSNITGATKGTVGMLTLASSLTMNTGSVFYVDISGATSDKLAITGALLSNGATLSFNGTPTAGDTYILATYASDTGSSFSYSAPTGFSVVDTGTMLELTPVPEPSTFVLPSLLVGWLLVGAARRRKARA